MSNTGSGSNRNLLCPCGSGKKYKKCCLNLEKEYKSIGKNYKGQDVLYNVSESKQRWDKLRNFVLENILCYESEERQIDVEKGLQLLENLYVVFDEAIGEFDEYTSCEKYCSRCCKLHVDTTALEAELIRRYVKENLNKKDIKEFEDNINLNSKYYPNYKLISTNQEFMLIKNLPKYQKEIEKYEKAKIPCAFLSAKGECLVYPVRPFSCRRYIIFSHPEQCELGEPNIKYENHIFILIEQALALIHQKIYIDGIDNSLVNKLSASKHLLSWFIKGFEETIKE